MKSLRRKIIVILMSGMAMINLLSQESSFFTIIRYPGDINISSVSSLANNEYVITGTARDRNNDIVVVVFDHQGNYKWSRLIDFYDEKTGSFTQDEGINLLNLRNDSSFVVLGATLNSENTVVLKYNLYGELSWNNWIKSGFNYCTNIYSSGDQIIITGAYATINDLSVQKPLVMKLDAEGKELWKTEFSLTGWPSTVGQVHSLVQNNDGSFLLAGKAKESVASGTYYAFASKMDFNGNIVWTKTYDALTDNNVKVFVSASGLNYTMIYPGNAGSIRISNLNLNGTLSESHDVSLNGLTFPPNFTILNNQLYAASHPEKDSSGCYFLKIGRTDMTAMDSAFQVSDKFDFRVKYVSVAFDSTFVITGNIASESAEYSNTAFIIKLDRDGKTLLEPRYDFISQVTEIKNSSSFTGINITSINNKLVIMNNSTRDALFSIFDIAGKKLMTGKALNNSEIEILKTNFKKGLYVVRVFDHKFYKNEKFIVD